MSAFASHHQEQRNARLAELEATRRQIEAYQALLQEVPTVFERKFRERMQPVLERNRQIAAESQLLREQLSLALPPSRSCETAKPLDDAGASAAPVQAASPPNPNRPAGKGNAVAKREPAWASAKASLVKRALTLRFPRRWPRPRLWGAAGITALGLSLLAVVPLSRQLPLAQLAQMLHLAPLDRNALGPEELQIISTGSWVEVEDASGNLLYAGILEGKRRFAIGPALRLNAGRPDLVTYQIGSRPVAPLGAIEDVGWRTLVSPLKNPAAIPALDAPENQP